MFGIFEVFTDTILICTLTAMVILCSGIPVGYGADAGAELTISGFTATYGNWVSILPPSRFAVLHFPLLSDGDCTVHVVWSTCLLKNG